MMFKIGRGTGHFFPVPALPLLVLDSISASATAVGVDVSSSFCSTAVVEGGDEANTCLNE